MRDLGRSLMEVGNNPGPAAIGAVNESCTTKTTLAKIELLVCLTALLLVLRTIFGLSRHWYTNRMLKIALLALYTFPSHLISHTLGLMEEASSELFPVWATFLMLFFRSSGYFSDFSLEDNGQWVNYNWEHLLRNILLAKMLIFSKRSWMFWVVVAIFGVMCLFLFVKLKGSDKAKSLVTASGYDVQRTTKLISDYMSSEHQSSDPHDLDPIRMRGYNYVVRGEETRWVEGSPLDITDEVVTVEKVWACQGWLLRGGDEDGKLKDICLSFSLYKILSLRFCSYSLPKEAHKKLWKLIRDGLLAEKNGHERAFRVIELELSFLFDSFYTKYPIIFQSGRWKQKLMEILLLFIGSLVIIMLSFTSSNSNGTPGEAKLATLEGLSFDVIVTSLILVVCTCVELVQLILMAISEWAKVILLCKYVRTNSWQGNKRIEKLIGLICRTQLLMPWERKLRQYSLLESHGYSPPRWACIPARASYINLVREGKKQSPPAKLSSAVKQAVFHSLMSNLRVLENGKASLRLNKVAGKLSWACELEKQPQVILVWHIATSICEHEVRISDPNFFVATSLSKYLAYLVVFAPQLLPDRPDDTEYVFNQAVLKSRELLKGCKTGEERIQKWKEIGNIMDGTGNVINWGAQLGQQLLKDRKDPTFIWKVLAEFWAELMVYVAPSDDAKAHAEHLAMGGEFLTHLWALVSHAGIKREPPIERPTLKRCRSWSN